MKSTGKATDQRKLWEQQRGESPKAFAAFCIYRDLGPQRTLSVVSAKVYSPIRPQTGTDPAPIRQQFSAEKKPASGQVKAWSAKFDWSMRAQAWDGEVDRHKRLAVIDENEKMARRQGQHAEAASAYLISPIRSILQMLASDPNALLDAGEGTLRLAKLATSNARALPRVQAAERLARLGGDGKLPPVVLEDEADTSSGGVTINVFGDEDEECGYQPVPPEGQSFRTDD